MTFVVTPHSIRPIPADQVLALYHAEGWWPERTAEQVAAVLTAGPAVGAWVEDRLVGLARVVSDGVLRAYVEDVLVAPELRGEGVGQALMTTIMRELVDVHVVSLFCAPELAGYYEASGFRATRQVVSHRA